MRVSRFAAALFVALVIAASVGPCSAAVTVQSRPTAGLCSVQSTPALFGDGDHHASATIPFEIEVTCPAGFQYSVAIAQMPQCGSQRYMTKGPSAIPYVLFTPDRQSVWCDGSNGTAVVYGVGTGAPQYFSGYATILASDPVANRLRDGTYRDNLLISVGAP